MNIVMPLRQFFPPRRNASYKRFRLLRNFSIVSLGGFVLTASLLSMFYRRQAIHDLTYSSEEASVTLTQVLTNTMWAEYGDFISSTQSLDNNNLAVSMTIRHLRRDVLAQLEGSSVAKVKIFDLQGRTVFSTDPSQIGNDKSQSPGFIAALSGQVLSQLDHRDTFKALQKTLKDRKLLSSYVPVYADGRDSEIIAVAEVYNDVTPVVVRIQQTQRNIAIGSLGVLSVLYLVLLSFVNKASQLIATQYQQVQASEKRYQQQADELEVALTDLKNTQAQMLHSEKMSSLGQMVAGIAHEINNPVGFIHGNIGHLKDHSQNLLDYLQLYEKHYPNPEAEIREYAEDEDVDYVKQDIESILSSMRVGTERIREIVLSLRNFSRMDEADCKIVNIHEGIENTLMILQHRLKKTSQRPAITVVRDFDKLPKVECYAGQLNQVFMNVIANSIDALESRFDNHQEQQEPLQVKIRTESHDTSVTVSITDNGSGIPDEIKRRIFDPFFTTKAVGKGTGMGMAISYQIITEKHKGKIQCFSDIGIGTEITLEVPLRLSETQEGI